MKIIVIFLVLISMVYISKAQVPYKSFDPHLYPYFFPMINDDEEQIKNEMEQVGGILKMKERINPTGATPSIEELIYTVNDSVKRKHPVHMGLDIYKAIFYLKNFPGEKSKLCYEYSLWYSSRAFLPDLINLFDNHNRVGFRRVGKGLKWISKSLSLTPGKREVDIIKNGIGFVLKTKRF